MRGKGDHGTGAASAQRKKLVSLEAIPEDGISDHSYDLELRVAGGIANRVPRDNDLIVRLERYAGCSVVVVGTVYGAGEGRGAIMTKARVEYASSGESRYRDIGDVCSAPSRARHDQTPLAVAKQGKRGV